MSSVSTFSVYSHCNDLGGKVWNPSIRWTKKYAVFIVLETDTGVIGLGECWCFDSAPDTLVAFLRTEVAPHVLGSSVDHFDVLYRQLNTRATLTARHGILASALSGVDIAMWDIRSRQAGLPLWAYLQNAPMQSSPSNTGSMESQQGCVRLYGSGGLYGENKPVNVLAAEMKRIAAVGFDIVKMKVGGLSLSEDLSRVSGVLNELDDSTQLIVDGVYSYTPEDALAFYNRLPMDRIEAFQSPVPAVDSSGMRNLCLSGVPVMGTEAEYREEMLQHLVKCGAVRFLQTAPIACGGLSRLMELSSLVMSDHSHSIKISLEVSSTAVALLSACHFAAANAVIAHTEYHFIHQVFFDHMNLTPVTDKPGYFKLSNEPGLGFSLPQVGVEQQFSLAV